MGDDLMGMLSQMDDADDENNAGDKGMADLLGSLMGGGGGGGDSAGGLGALLGGLMGGGARSSSAPGAGASGGLGSLLDLDGDGNALDDILGMAGKLMR